MNRHSNKDSKDIKINVDQSVGSADKAKMVGVEANIEHVENMFTRRGCYARTSSISISIVFFLTLMCGALSIGVQFGRINGVTNQNRLSTAAARTYATERAATYEANATNSLSAALTARASAAPANAATRDAADALATAHGFAVRTSIVADEATAITILTSTAVARGTADARGTAAARATITALGTPLGTADARDTATARAFFTALPMFLGQATDVASFSATLSANMTATTTRTATADAHSTPTP